MSTTSAIVSIIVALGALFLAVRNLRGQGLSFERGAGMAGVWIIVIAILAFVLSRLGY